MEAAGSVELEVLNGSIQMASSIKEEGIVL